MTFGARYTSALPHGVAETKRTEGAQCHFESEGKVTKDERKGSEERGNLGSKDGCVCI